MLLTSVLAGLISRHSLLEDRQGFAGVCVCMFNNANTNLPCTASSVILKRKQIKGKINKNRP